MYNIVDRATARIRALEAFQLRPGINIAGFVRSTGQSSDPDDDLTFGYGGDTYPGFRITDRFYTSLATAFANCDAGKDNVIFVLPGHSESVGTALMDNCIAGTTVVGLGESSQSNGPTLLWSGATSNLAVDTANVTFANLRMMADTNNVTEAITVTASGFKLVDCYVDAGIGASQDILSFLSFSTGASDGLVAGNFMRATAGGQVTLIKGGTVVDNLQIIGNHIIATSQNTALGNIHISAALTNMTIGWNVIEQTIAAGTAAISFTDVAATGSVCYNLVGCLADTTVQQGGIVLAGTTNILVHFYENYNSDGVKGTSGALSPTVTT